MQSTGIVYPEQLWVRTEVRERRHAANIQPGTPEYEAEGARIIAFYENGARTIYQLLAALDEPTEGGAGGASARTRGCPEPKLRVR
jgi:hypothetical protein